MVKKKEENEFRLPKSSQLSGIDINNCTKISEDISRTREINKKKYSKMIEGVSCNAILSSKQNKYYINKSKKSEVKQARIFCNQMNNPQNDKRDIKGIEKFVETWGESKGKYYFYNEQYEFQGKGENICEAVMDIKSPTGENIIRRFESPNIYISKPKK